MSSWAALTERARLVAGETVLVNGATGTSGRLAVRIAKHLGAAKVVATGRNAAALQALLGAGADAVVSLQQDDAHLARALEPHFRAGVDVVLDYLWGASAQTLLVAAAKATPEGRRLRFVQIGSIGGADVLLPGAVLRATAIELMGSGLGSVSLPRLLASVRGVFDAAGPAGLAIETRAVPLADVGVHWAIRAASCDRCSRWARADEEEAVHRVAERTAGTVYARDLLTIPMGPAITLRATTTGTVAHRERTGNAAQRRNARAATRRHPPHQPQNRC